MPLQEFVCASQHSHERLVRQTGGPGASCPTCGADATPTSVHRIAVGYRGKWGSEFQMPPDQRDAHEQAVGWKQEYVAALEEATGNGFQ